MLKATCDQTGSVTSARLHGRLYSTAVTVISLHRCLEARGLEGGVGE